MYKQRLANPYYLKNGVKHTTFNIRKIGGVYIIYDLKKNIKYIGMSTNNLYRTMYHHFESWNDNKNFYPQVRVLYNGDKVKCKVTYIDNIEKILKLEKALILKYRDKFKLDNPNQYRKEKQDEKSKKVLTEFMETETSPVVQYEGETPF